MAARRDTTEQIVLEFHELADISRMEFEVEEAQLERTQEVTVRILDGWWGDLPSVLRAGIYIQSAWIDLSVRVSRRAIARRNSVATHYSS